MKYLPAIIIGLVFCIGTGCWLESKEPDQAVVPVPTFIEVQQMLVDRGYDIGTDGVDGVIGPNTIKGWDRAICDQEASRMFKKMAGARK